jgi:serine/threonine protein kinase
MAGDDSRTGKADTLASPSEESARAEAALGSLERCPDEDGVLAYLDGRSTEAERVQIERHLDGCNDCWLLVQSLLADARSGSDDARPSSFRVTTFGIGSVIAERYHVERFIGKGGMGEVYLAHDALMSRQVALKTPLCTTTDDPSALRKFFDEARNVDRITHPNICRIYTLQEHRDPRSEQPPIPFFTMEYIEGETLAQRVKAGPLALPTVRAIARQLLLGLRAAHAKGVLHLDFKSDNIMLRRDQASLEVVLMDFGLSRQRDVALRVSQCQRGIGTLPYMALEQLEGQRNLSPAVDVYAFGVVLFEMLTGRFPFVEGSLGTLLMKQLRERAPAPSSLRPELSAELDAFVARCLHRSPRRRFDDAGAALVALEELREWTKPRPLPRRPPFLREALLGLGFVFGSASDSLPPSEPAIERAHALTPAPTRAIEAAMGLAAGAVGAPAVPAVLPSRAPALAPSTDAASRMAARPASPAPLPASIAPGRPTAPASGTAAGEPPPQLAGLPHARRAPSPAAKLPPPAARKLRAVPRAPIPFTRRRGPSESADEGRVGFDSG